MIRVLSRRGQGDLDLVHLEMCCRLKAEAVRWILERQSQLRAGARLSADIQPKDEDLLHRAKSLDCYLWICRPPASDLPISPDTWDDVAGCFEAMADALALVQVMRCKAPSTIRVRPYIELLAESQSALRIAVSRVRDRHDDHQLSVFYWLRHFADENDLYIRQFMSVSSAATSTSWQDIRSRSQSLLVQWQREQQRVKNFQLLQDCASTILHSDEVFGRWEALVAATDELVRDGVPPSNLQLRSSLLALLDRVPDDPDAPESFWRVVREIELFVARRPSKREAPVIRLTPEVLELRRLLKGRKMVIIGGYCRQNKEIIRNALDLDEVVWISAKPGQSYRDFEPQISRAGVAVVVITSRWASHSLANTKSLCERHDRCFVRLPAGYRINQLASQILNPCGNRLREQFGN